MELGFCSRRVLLALVLLCGCNQTTGQDECVAVQGSDLGNTSTPSSMPAIITDAAKFGDGSTTQNVQLFNFSLVCLAVGLEADRYRYASVVVEYSCSGTVPAGSPLGCDSGGTTNYTAQFDLECNTGVWILAQSTLFGSVGANVFQPPHATVNTEQRKDCSFCVDPTRSTALEANISADTHCSACDASCTGLGYCRGTPSSFCCNYYTNDELGTSQCLATDCPSPQVPDETFICDCPPFFTGLPDCLTCGLTCEQGGTPETTNCSMCFCPMGYTGTRCEEDVNECLDDPCENGATCNNTSGGYLCICATGYTGFSCDQDIDECTDVMPCMNGATCSNTAGSYMCTCATGYTGFTCNQDIDECTDDMPCMNNATCNNAPGSYTCVCNTGYTGFNCGTCNETCESGMTCEVVEGMAVCLTVNPSDSDSDDDLSDGAIAGIVIGCLIFLLLLIIVITAIIVIATVFSNKKKRAKVIPTSSKQEEKLISKM